MNINGKCLCGRIQYLLEASPSDLAYCVKCDKKQSYS